jgi:hypothetical protein
MGAIRISTAPAASNARLPGCWQQYSTGQTVGAREIVPTKDSPVWVRHCQQNLICHSCFIAKDGRL